MTMMNDPVSLPHVADAVQKRRQYGWVGCQIPNTRMNPQQITITAAMAEAICGYLKVLELDHNDTSAGLLGAEICGLLAADIEAPEPPPEPEEEEPEPEPEPELEVEAPEPCPDSLGDEFRAAWLEYNRDNPGEEIPETMWLEFVEGQQQAAIEAQLERYPFR